MQQVTTVRSDTDILHVLQLYLFFDLQGCQEIAECTSGGITRITDLCESLYTTVTEDSVSQCFTRLALLDWLTGSTNIDSEEFCGQISAVTRFISGIQTHTGTCMHQIMNQAASLQGFVPQITHQHIQNTYLRLRDTQETATSTVQISRVSYTTEL